MEVEMINIHVTLAVKILSLKNGMMIHQTKTPLNYWNIWKFVVYLQKKK